MYVELPKTELVKRLREEPGFEFYAIYKMRLHKLKYLGRVEGPFPVQLKAECDGLTEILEVNGRWLSERQTFIPDERSNN